MKIFISITCLLMFSVIAFSVPAQGAGIWFNEHATPDMGTASAGRAATADNAAIAGDNPAGMTRLDRNELNVGIAPLYYDAKFDTKSSTFGGGDGGSLGGWMPEGSLAYVHSLSPNLKLGLAVSSYFGLGLEYSNDWAGRYYVTETELLTIGINPSIGYKVNDKLSIGAGLNLIYSTLEQKAAINNPEPGVSDGKLKLKDDDIGYGFNLGVLFEATDATRVGITYRSKVDIEFKDLVSIKGLGPILGGIFDGDQKIDMDMNLPQAVMLSLYHDVNDKLAIVANLGWQDWSDFGKSDITIKDDSDSTTLTDDRNFKDAWHSAIGVRYRLSPAWMVMSGFSYDSSPVDDKDRTPDMPLDRQLRYAIGGQHEYNNDITISAAYELMDGGDAKINQDQGPLTGELKGEYDTNYIHFFTVNVNWRF